MSARNSIRPTYDSRETGPRYHITTCVGSQFIDLEKRMPDPFVHQTVIIGWRDLLRGLRHRSLTVTVTVSADPDVIEDVLELDNNYLGPGQNTRRAAFNSHLAEAMARMVNEDPGAAP